MTVTLPTLLLSLLGYGLAILGVLWLVRARRRRKQRNRYALSVVSCRICGVRYETEPEPGLTICPVCHTPNDTEPDDSL
jgi:hypothetical protein